MLSGRNHSPGFGMAEDIFNLRIDEACVNRYHDGLYQIGRQPAMRKLETIGKKYGCFVTLFEPCRQETACNLLDG